MHCIKLYKIMKKAVLLTTIIIFCFVNITFSQSGEFYGNSKVQSFSIVDKSIPDHLLPVNVFVQRYVEQQIETWQQRGEFEPTAAYQERVNEQTRNAKVQKLTDEALAEFKNLYTQSINWKNLELGRYDADNQAYLITSSQLGDFAINIPLADAPAFRDNWSKVKFEKPDYYVNNDKLVLAKLELVLHTGKRYTYDSKHSTVYYADNIKYNFAPIEVEVRQDNVQTGQTRIESREMTVGKADVAVNIPVNPQTNDKTFALIISNENYRRESKVPFAINDGSTFREYCEKTLGIPSRNIHFAKDATFGEMRSELNWIKQVIAAFPGEAKIIFYYAGHGMPDEKDRTAYLLPTDGFSTDYETAIKLSYVYNLLTEHPSKSVTVFLDACFSGADRTDNILAAESGQRGVRIRPREDVLNGNIVVFSAATGDETAFPYNEKQHGMFTYFLLKKLQETKGNVDLNTLSNYIISNVNQQSVLINRKSQTPQVNTSIQMQDTWKTLRLR